MGVHGLWLLVDWFGSLVSQRFGCWRVSPLRAHLNTRVGPLAGGLVAGSEGSDAHPDFLAGNEVRDGEETPALGNSVGRPHGVVGGGGGGLQLVKTCRGNGVPPGVDAARMVARAEREVDHARHGHGGGAWRSDHVEAQAEDLRAVALGAGFGIAGGHGHAIANVVRGVIHSAAQRFDQRFSRAQLIHLVSKGGAFGFEGDEGRGGRREGRIALAFGDHVCGGGIEIGDAHGFPVSADFHHTSVP